MTEKNDSICAVVTGFGSNGEGVIGHEGITFFTPYCMPDEEVRFRVLKVKNSVGYGKVEEIIRKSKDRAEAKCPAFMRCGGCQLQHVAYDAQLAFKAQQVENAFKKIAGLNVSVPPARASEKQYGYRNKLQLPIGADKDGRTVVGFYAERSHRIVEIDECPIHPDWAKKLIAAVKEYASVSGEHGFDERTKTGNLRHVVARELDGKFVVTVVTKTRKLKKKELLIELLKKAFETFTLWQSVHEKDDNVVLGDEFILLYGAGFFEAEEKGIAYEAGPQTFVQVNADVRGKLYDRALAMVTGDGDEVVVDAYSGGGLLTAMIAKRAKRAYGIEIEREAVACADKLKERNALSNMTNICGAVEDKLPAVLEREKGEKVRLVLDPPRAGIARSVLYALKESGIPKLTLISCNPATLARDVGILTGALKEQGGELLKSEADGEYRIDSVEAWDMFPQTKHVETLITLCRK